MKLIIKIIVISILILNIAACDSKTAGKTESKKSMPNIVILYADDMGYGDMSCQNTESKINTPHLDKLASEGIRFTDGHSSSGICTPSRYALLTGNYHWRSFYTFAKEWDQGYFRKNELTMAEMLKKQGYKTAMVGKWHLGWDWNSVIKPGAVRKLQPVGNTRKTTYFSEDIDWSKSIPDGPTDHGFDYYYGDGTINFPPYTYIENDRVTEVPTEHLAMKTERPLEGNWECRPGPRAKGWDVFESFPKTTNKAISYIKKQKEGVPFFLYFSFPAPHAPIVPIKKYQGKSKAGSYGDYVLQVDDVVGQVMEALRNQGLDDNTIVVFSSDNGPATYMLNRIDVTGHNSSWKLRGKKRDVWEGGHRVPFLIRWPEKIKPGVISHETISQIDLMATFAKITDYKLGREDAVDSHDMLDIVEGTSKNNSIREATVHNTNQNMWVLRQGDWTAVFYIREKNPKSPELYNLKNDIGQSKNVAAQYPERVKSMKALLDKIRDQGHSAPRLN